MDCVTWTAAEPLKSDEIAQLEKQLAHLLENEADEQGDLPPKADQQYAELETQIAAIQREAGFTLAQKANAGVVITISHSPGSPGR